MDVISRIKARIESLNIDSNKLCEKNRYVNESAHQYYGGKRDGYRVAIRIIESLEKEQSDIEIAAIRVWESWNGGTMNDVRRDMDALGKLVEPLRKAMEDKK